MPSLSTVNPVPEGYSAVTPCLVVRDAPRAIDFYQRALGAELVMRMDAPDGSVAHAELRVAGVIIMLSEESEQWGSTSPTTLGGTASSLMVYVPDVDAVFDRAVAAGASVNRPVADQFYGDRTGTITDPFGHQWTIGTHIEDLTPDEMARRATAFFDKG